MDTTAHDLRLLSIGYFVQGGIFICSGILGIGYLGLVGVLLASARSGARATPRNQLPPDFLYVFGAIAIAIAILTLAGGVCMLLSGMALRNRRNRTLVLVMAALNCLAMPYGTVLGIFTFLVLQRPAAREMFAQPAT